MIYFNSISATITGSRFEANKALIGGAIAAEQSDMTLEGVSILYNIAVAGGGINVQSSSTLNVFHCFIDGNYASCMCMDHLRAR